MKATTLSQPAISKEEMLAHWLGHRGLTRRIIEAFPEEKLFSHSIGGMRTFAAIVQELLAIGAPGLKEIALGETKELQEHLKEANSKSAILKLWDQATEEIIKYWKEIPAENFQNKVKTFGQYEGTVLSSIQYFIDNEIHHRAQGYVYLRSLGVEPPPFWDRY